MTSRSRRTSATALIVAAACLASAPGAVASTLRIGVADPPGGAERLAARSQVAYRYQYLVGDPASQASWRHWNPGGSFVTRYVRESVRARITPVFTYYTLLNAAGRFPGGEADKDLAALRDAQVMGRWIGDLRLALQRVQEASGRRRAVVHVEPDLWGYVQQRAQHDDATSVPAAVDASGDPDAAGLPDTAAGLAQLVVRLRDRHAPDVRIAWHLSTWGTRRGTTSDNPSRREIDVLAARSARFAHSLGARFDLIFNDVADRDDGFRRKVLGERPVTHHWGRGDVVRHLRWVRGVTRATRTKMVLWQLPLGHRRLPNTWRRYRDNRVDLLLGSRRNLRRARRAGIVALLFGPGTEGCTTPATDGGHFFRLTRRYARNPL